MKQLFIFLLLFGLLSGCQQQNNTNSEEVKIQNEEALKAEKTAIEATSKAHKALEKAKNTPLSFKSSNELILNDSLFAHAPSDRVTITNARIDGKHLELKVKYGGGCGKIAFQLLAGKTNPTHIPIRLSVDDNDICAAVHWKTLRFKLQPTPHSSNNKVTFMLAGWGTPLVYKY